MGGDAAMGGELSTSKLLRSCVGIGIAMDSNWTGGGNDEGDLHAEYCIAAVGLYQGSTGLLN